MSEATTHAHHYQHFEDLQMSSGEFYGRLESLIKDYQYPNVECRRVTLKEDGVFSSSRDYLAISRKLYTYYVCAAPFGRSFFISWWLKESANTAANVAAKVPLIGKAVAQRMESKSYYALDTELMFTNSIHSLIKSAVDAILIEKGFRKPDAIAPGN